MQPLLIYGGSMSEILNATCKICGTKYHMCETCKDIKTYRPWRTVTDVLPHYLIYLALANYTKTNDKKEAREALLKCDLSGLDSFDADVKKVIKEILKDNEEKAIVVKPIKRSSQKPKEGI